MQVSPVASAHCRPTTCSSRSTWTRAAHCSSLERMRPGEPLRPCRAQTCGKVHLKSSRKRIHPIQASRQEGPPSQPPPPSSNPPLEWVQERVQVVAQAWQASESRQVIQQALESSGVNSMLPPAVQPYAVPVFLASAVVEAALLLFVVRKVVGGWFKSTIKAAEEGSDATAQSGVAGQLGSVVATAVGVPQAELEATIQGAAQSKKELQRLREQVEAAQSAAEAMQARLRTQLVNREEELSKALKTASELQQELQNVQSVVLVREKELEEVQVAALKKADEAKAALKESQRKVALLEAMVLALRGRLQEEEEKSAQLTKAVQDRDLKIKTLESQRSELVGRVEELRGQLASRQEQLKDAMERCTSLEQTVSNLEEKSSSLQSKVDRLEVALHKQSEEARLAAVLAEEHLAALQAQAAEGDAALMRAKAAIDEKVQEVRSLKGKLQGKADLAEQLRHKELELQQAQELGQQLSVKLDQLAQDRAVELEEVRTKLQRELLSTQRKSEATESELNTVKKELFGVMVQLLGSADTVSDTVQGLSSDLQDMLSSEANKYQASHKVQERAATLQESIKENQSALAQLRQSTLPGLSPYLRGSLTQAERKLMAANKTLQTILQDSSTTPVAKRRAQRDVQSAEADVEALYRSAMPLDVRQQERNLRAQLRDKEVELNTLQAELVAEQDKGSALGQLLAEKLNAEASARETALKERLRQNEGDLQALQESEEQLRDQIRLLEQSWRAEIEEVQKSLETGASGRNNGSPGPPKPDSTAKQATQIVAELRTVRDQLFSQSQQVKQLRAVYEGKMQGAQANADKARGQVTKLSENVTRLESELKDHELKVESLRSALGIPAPVNTLGGIDGTPDAATSSRTSVAPTKAAASPSSIPEGNLPASQWGRSQANGTPAAPAAPASTSARSIFPSEEQLAKEVQAMAQSILGSSFGMKTPPGSTTQPPSTSTPIAQKTTTTPSTNGTTPPASNTASAPATPTPTTTTPISSTPATKSTPTTSTTAPQPSPPIPSTTTPPSPPPTSSPSSNTTPSATSPPSPNSSSNGTSAPGRNGTAPLSSPAAATSRPQGAVPGLGSRPGAGAALETSSGRGGVAVAAPAKVLRLVTAGCSLPSDYKVEKGGEDAFFAIPAGLGAFGVADGVGGWAEDGVDPAAYAQGLMASCKEVVERGARAQQEVSSVDVLDYAQQRVELPGSSTVCVAIMREEGLLEVANLGDSGLRLLRGSKCVFSTDVQEHQFNMPYQMACPSILSMTDTAADAEVYNATLESGDVLVMGSDGLFDNMWEQELEEIVARHFNNKRPRDEQGAQELARMLANTAMQNARNPNFRSPWAVEAARVGAVPLLARMFPRGGKMDDVTAVVAFADA